jgi:hypothetical protein
MTVRGRRESELARVERCDLCILGAGIAGLNALFAATHYLTSSQRVVLIDRNPRPGGMWNDAYDYVRLHQPHGLFTAGNIPWKLGRPRDYLAGKSEVLDHLQHCVEVLGTKVTLDVFYGYEYESHQEVRGEDGVEVRISCAPTSPAAPPLRVEAGRFVKAYGAEISPKAPLELSSAKVVSLSPDQRDLLGGDLAASAAPVYVVGGGKTAVDTAHALLSRFPGRDVNVVAGSGMVFTSRDKMFPAGARRWWGGVSPTTVMMDVARRFDGTNEREVHEYFRARYGTSVFQECRHFLFGTLSEEESETVAAGVNEVMMEHLADVVDREGRTEMVFRSGRTRAIEPGSFVVNCTGYLLVNERPYEPYVSEQGAVVSVQLRSAVHVLSSLAAYFLVHLLYTGKIRETRLYELDLQALQRASRSALPFGMLALAIHNAGHLVEAVPRRALSECGIDLECWYPLPRRLLTLLRFMWNRRRDVEHHRRSLDTLRERFGVRCGPLDLASRSTGASA